MAEMLPKNLENTAKRLLFDEAFLEAYTALKSNDVKVPTSTLRRNLISTALDKSRISASDHYTVTYLERYLNIHANLDPYDLRDEYFFDNLEASTRPGPREIIGSNEPIEFVPLGRRPSSSQNFAAQYLANDVDPDFYKQASPNNETQNSKGNIMQLDKQVAVQSVTYIYGVPESEVTNSQIISHVSALEAQVEELGKIKVKSSKVADNIKSIGETITKLVDILDARK